METATLVLEYIKTFIWPVVVIIICFVFRGQLVALLNRLRRAELPGGFTVDLDKQIEEVKAQSAKVQEEPIPPEEKREPTIPVTEANARMIRLGLQPSPSGLDISYYRNLAQQSPTLALVGLRTEIEILVRNLILGFKISLDIQYPVWRLIEGLRNTNSITEDQKLLFRMILSVCNRVVYGPPVSDRMADNIFDSAEVLVDQYLGLLSWGFDDK